MKKNIIIILLICLSNKLTYSQSDTYRILNLSDSTAVEFAHILSNDKLITYSDEKGNFNLDFESKIDTLIISHLSFKTKKILKKELDSKSVFFLEEISNSLDEVVIEKVKKKTIRLLPDKSIRGLSKSDLKFPYSFKIAVFIPNLKKEKGFVINKILFESRNKSIKDDNKFIPFKVNLMTVDSITRLPKDSFFKKDLVVGKLENQTLVEININEVKDIDFPENGVFVIVSLYEEEYYLNNGFLQRPKFGAARLNKNSEFRELNRVLRFGAYNWEEPFYSKERIQCFNFGIEVSN